ncbi:MAG: CAP domain-containing protein, partial [Planctomycetota bacterium]
HDEMERRVSAAVRLHNRTIRVLAEGLPARTRTVGEKRPTVEPLDVIRPVQRYGILVIDRGASKFLESYRARYEAWEKERGRAAPSRDDALLHALGALAREEYEAAAALGAGLAGPEGLLWETLRAAAVLGWNERHGAGHDRNELAGVRILNGYRVGLGLAPLVLDRRLHLMARDFAVQMARLRFFSHRHPHDPSRRTLGRRARRVGYPGSVGENVSTEGDGKKAVWRWRADAGHHRTLVRPFFRAVGLGCFKRSVLNPGTSTRARILPLYGAGDARSARRAG